MDDRTMLTTDPPNNQPKDPSQSKEDHSGTSSLSSLADYEEAIKCISMGISMHSLPTSLETTAPPSNNVSIVSQQDSPSLPSSSSSPSKSLTLSAKLQNMLAIKFTSRKTIKMFVDEYTGRVIDNLYYLMRDHTRSKSLAQNMINNIIKINLKFILLHHSDVFSSQEKEDCRRFEDQVHDFCEALVKLPRPPSPIDPETDESYCLLSYSLRLSRTFAKIPRYQPPTKTQLEEFCKMIEVMTDLVLHILEPHVGKSSKQRIVKVREFFKKVDFFQEIFSGKDMNVSKRVVELLDDVQVLMDRGII